MSYYSLEPVLITPPSLTPVSLEEAKAQCRIDHDFEDTLLTLLIEAATGHHQRVTGRAFVTQTWRAYFPAFSSEPLWLPLRPVQSITSISYFDENDDSQIASSGLYALYSANIGPHIRLTTGSVWPTSYERNDAVAVTFVAGYGDPEDVPAEICQAILLLVSTLYENRESNVIGQTVQSTGAMESLLSTHRVLYV
jgi:uncharacterized phiE125 gp8 family phage protein